MILRPDIEAPGLPAILAASMNFRRGGAADCTPPFAGINAYAAVKRPTAANQFPCIAAGWVEPQYFFGCQEAATALVDAVNGFTLPFVGAVTGGAGEITDYTVAGGDKWFQTTTETANQGAYHDKDTNPLQGWNVATQSVVAMGATCITSATAERVVYVMSGTTAQSVYFAVTAAGVLRVYCGSTANFTGSVVYENATPTPFWWMLAWNRTLQRLRLISKKLGTGAETLTPGSWATKPDGGKGYNVDVGSIPPVARHNWQAEWVGADAETMDARGATNLTDLTGGG